jgi:methyl-accepting chemotaxis protein
VKRLSVRLSLITLGISVLAGLAAGLIVYRGYAGFIESQIVSRLKSGVEVTAGVMDFTDPSAIERAGREKTDGYEGLVAELGKMSSGFGFSSTYLMRVDGPGKFVFVVDSEYKDPQKFKEWFGKIYDEPPAELAAALDGRALAVTARPYTDEFGTFRSAFLPVESGGKVVAILGADYDISTLTAQSRRGLVDLLLAVLAAAAVAGLVGVLVSRGIARPVREVAASLDRVAQGDLTVVVGEGRSDEIGRVQTASRAMVEKLNQLLGELRGAAAGVASSSDQLSAAARDLAAGAQSQAATLEQTSATVEELTGSVEQVAQHAQSQAASVQQSSASVQQLRQTIEQVGRTLSKVAEASTLSTTRAREGSEAVNRAAESIQRISVVSEQIAGIVTVISEIADQTNLLALNASIEAARAGEHGRGFAVVAEEVSKLADRSSASTKEIGTLIRESANVVSTGVATAKGALTAMGEIINGAETTTQMVAALGAEVKQSAAAHGELAEATVSISEMSQSISAATEQQTSSTSQVAGAIENVNGVTQQVASAAEQVSGSTKELSQLAGHLLSLVEQFKLSQAAVSTR